MELPQTDMYALYRAHFPMLVRRAESLAQEGLYGPLSVFLSNAVERATEMSKEPGWCQLGELERRERAYALIVDDARYDRIMTEASHLQKISVALDPDNIKARSSTTFWAILHRAQVRFRRSDPIWNCPIHAKAGRNRRQLAAAAQDKLALLDSDLQAARASVPADKREVKRLADLVLPLKQKIVELDKLVENARVHQIHYETARKYVKTIEENLMPGQVLIYRDFVNQYNEDKKKINNLVFVIIRPSPDGIGNIYDYVDCIAHTKCDAKYHSHCLDHLFQREDIFPRGTTVYISGDHGPHFWCWDTLAFQSTLFGKYGVRTLQLPRLQSLRRTWCQYQEGGSSRAVERRRTNNIDGVRAYGEQHDCC